jgi:hypothetical protein
MDEGSNRISAAHRADTAPDGGITALGQEHRRDIDLSMLPHENEQGTIGCGEFASLLIASTGLERLLQLTQRHSNSALQHRNTRANNRPRESKQLLGGGE